jgi:hypothetical protein
MNRRFYPSLLALSSLVAMSCMAAPGTDDRPNAVETQQRSLVPRWQQERMIRRSMGRSGRSYGGGSRDIRRHFMVWQSTSKKAKARAARASL